MADNTIKIGGELESMATGKIVAAASAIKDKSRNKTQEVINGDVEAAIAEQSAQFEELSEETSAAVASASQSAREAKQYLADLQEAITELPDGQAVSAQVAVNEVDIAGLKSDVVVDLSTRYATSYANLSAALTALNNDTSTDATAIKKGGVSVKFINSSTNKYEQWNLKASSWSINTSDWALDVDGSVTNDKLKLPFELEKPSSNEYVTQASEIGHNGQSLDKTLEGLDNISKQSTQSEEQAIVFETDGGTQVGKIDANGADFTNLKRGGNQVATTNQLVTKDTSIGDNPSSSHVPTTKAVKDYVDAHSDDYPIEKEITSSDTEEQVWSNDAETQEYAKIGSYGMKSKAYLDMQGNSIIDDEIGDTPSTSHAPSSKTVKDYVDEHGTASLPLEKTAISDSEEKFQFVTEGGTVVGEVTPEGADFNNLSKGGKAVATLEDIPQSNLPIERETVQGEDEEIAFKNENTNQTYARVNEKGVFAKGLYEIANSSKVITNRGNLSVGGILELEESHIHGSRRILFTADITSFTACKIGIGTHKYWSSWLEIDGTSVVLKNYTNEVVNTGISWTHGLTFKDNLQITLEVDHQGNMTFDLVSGGHKYTGSRNIDDTLTTSVTTYFLGVNGKVFFEATNAALTNCVLSFTCDGWNKDIHVYGDSYLHTLNGKRPYYYLAKHGYTKSALLNGFPGAGSLNAAPDLTRNLTHCRPKFIVWAMGMNDLDVDASTPSANWLSCVNTLLATCESLGIMPILCTIPSVIGGYSPDSGIGDMRIHKAKNDWVRNSGYRYIDFAKAVGASDVNGEWYNNGESDDFLESGSMRVHPTEYGALALYHQLIADFPEITNL